MCYFFLVATLIIIIYGKLFWFCGREYNEDLDSSNRPAATGMWRGVVTMTTLGYGDVTPKTSAGKILTSLCVVIGLLKLSLLTGTLIFVVTEKGSLLIKNQVVVVKNRIMEQLVVETKFNARAR